MMKAALDWISKGFGVFPCCWPDFNGKCACGRRHEAHDIGKVPLTKNGLKDATITQQGVRENWTHWPRANIGLVIPSDKFVLDVDQDTGGYESLAVLQERHDLLTETQMYVTGGLGQHNIYSTPVPIRNTTRLDNLLGLDIRGVGGYIIAAPSVHRSGRRYVLSHIWDGPIMPAPAWLINLCTRKTPTPGPAAVTPQGNPIPEGSRNDTLTRHAGAMRRRGLSERAIYAALVVENQERCQPPLPETDIQRIAQSVSRYQPIQTTNPRTRGFSGVTI